MLLAGLWEAQLFEYCLLWLALAMLWGALWEAQLFEYCVLWLALVMFFEGL